MCVSTNQAKMKNKAWCSLTNDGQFRNLHQIGNVIVLLRGDESLVVP